jgi:zinc protease
LDQLIEKGLTKEDFELTKEFLRSYIKLYAQSPGKQLGFLLDSKFYGRTNYLAEMDKLLEKTTLADVNNAIKKYWQTSNMDIVIVTDKSEAEALSQSLQSGEVSPMAYSNSLKASLAASILEEDKLVENYSFPVKSVKVIDSDKVFISK